MQRVTRARVVVESATVGEIGVGMLVLLGIDRGDSESEVVQLATKLAGYRFFRDDAGKTNRAVTEVAAAALVVSQFTLCAAVDKGRRPSFDGAEEPSRARALCEAFVARLRELGVPTQSGVFGAHMEVELVNDGPVTLVFEAGARSA